MKHKIEKIEITSKDREKILPSVVFIAEKLNEIINHLNQEETPTSESWEKEFDKCFSKGFCGNCENKQCIEHTSSAIKSFITDLLTSERNKVIDEVIDRILKNEIRTLSVWDIRDILSTLKK